MKCEYVEQLLPLYVGGDLVEERSQVVAAHLQQCTRCAGAADEYAGASQLLQQLAPPFFSDQVYASVRRQVLNEIERQSHAPVWSSMVSQVFARLVQPRMRWVTAGLLLATSVAAFYFIAKESNQLPNEQQLANNSRIGKQNADKSRADLRPKNKSSAVSSLPSRKLPDRFRRAPVTEKRTEKVGLATTNRLSPRNEDTKEPDVDVTQPLAAPAPLRVELQTGDPNIRIIWLSGQRFQTPTRETSKGT